MSIQQTPLSADFGLLLTSSGGSSLDSIPLDDLVRDHGAVLLSGFNLSLDTFLEFSNRHGHDFSNYEGGVFRIGSIGRDSIGGDPTLMTTTGHSQGFPIGLHGEMHYLLTPPERIWFFCQTPSESAGQTTLCDGRAIWRGLSESTRAYFRETRIRYTRSLEDGDWQATFGTEDREAVGRICLEQRMEWSFEEDQGTHLTTHYLCSAVRDGEVFINNVLPVLETEWAFSSGWMKENLADIGERRKPFLTVRTAEGEPLPKAIVKEVRSVAESLTLEVDWKAGDMAVVDNHRVMHGRRQAPDSRRSVLVRLSKGGPKLVDATPA